MDKRLYAKPLIHSLYFPSTLVPWAKGTRLCLKAQKRHIGKDLKFILFEQLIDKQEESSPHSLKKKKKKKRHIEGKKNKQKNE